MKYVTPSILFALAVLAFVFWFLHRCARVRRSAPLPVPALGQVHAPERLSFAGKRHPMDRKDRLPLLIITLVYALTAFFQLGDFTAPQDFVDFRTGDTLTIEITGEVLYPSSLRYYTGLGTGKYNLAVSSDGNHWSTLWSRTEKDQWDRDQTIYYWADAQDRSPSYAMTQQVGQVFKWLDIPLDNPINIRYLRLTAQRDTGQSVLELGRLALVDKEGKAIPFNWTLLDSTVDAESAAGLFYTGDVPDKSTWHNSAYFDEIYHARTAKENVDGVYPYEWTHPPLGKLIISLGIRLFGMTPFGWRFMGTLLGVLMLPILYIFLKNLFGKTAVAACGTILFAADFMHLTQTRIATIDTYAVFFILCMYFFMYRYLTLPAGTPFRKGAPSLFLSGLMWGLGAASKWTVVYAGIGLAVLYFMGLYQKLRDWPLISPIHKGAWVVKTLLFSVLCFILIPFAIYTASYLPYALALGDVDLSLPNTLRGLGRSLPPLFQNLWAKITGAAGAEDWKAADIPQDSLSGIMAKNQWDMFTYHQRTTSAHPYSSRWFQWIVDARPILYYMDNTVPGYTTRFAAFANPVLCWTGLGAVVVCAAHSFRRTWAKAAFLGGLGVAAAVLTYRAELGKNGAFYPELEREVLLRNWIILAACLLLFFAFSALILLRFPGHSGKAAFLLTAYLSQLAPWWLIGRTTFEYHYFPSILFLVFAVSYLFDILAEEDRHWRGPVYGLTGLSAALYALFYPVLTGLTIPTWYQPLVQWLLSWPL